MQAPSIINLLFNRSKKHYAVPRVTLGKIRNQAFARGEGELCVLALVLGWASALGNRDS